MAKQKESCSRGATRRTFVKGIAAAGAGLVGSRAIAGATRRTAGDGQRMEAVLQFAETVLQEGGDRYGPKPTPLFVDGLNVDTRQPVRWVHRGQAWICSNLASQQNLFRTLAGLSALTGRERYRQRAADAVGYHFEHLVRSCGLLQWGGHRFYDAAAGRFVGEQDTHELKCSYPFYELLWEVDPVAAERFIKALWNAHVLDWSRLDMNRHGRYDLKLGKLWGSRYAGSEPFFEGKGLTFINTGSDLYYAATLLHAFSNDPAPLTWARRLLNCYVQARDPETGLGAYQYSQPAKLRDLPGEATSSSGGDRARRQFGPEFGDRALEGRVLDPGRAEVIYGRASLCQLRMAELAGEAGQDFLRWTHEGLLAYARHAYDHRTNLVRGMFTDGAPITPGDVVRPGYYSPQTFRPRPASTLLLLAYAAAFRCTQDAELWTTVRAMARAHRLGDLGVAPGRGLAVAFETGNADPHALLSLLEILRVAPAPDYLDLARRIGDNLVNDRLHKGLFVPSSRHILAPLDAVEPLALLALEAHLDGDLEAVPPYPAGRGYIHGPHDGFGRTYDSRAIWSKTRSG